ncbi:Oidioi.mRNA.OKI2018_I69.chr1.g1281.t1.cds [Oikopleura dioica]|uniref:Oidioi.mRNA.OKI2018_I69.chr1.g1281.t1.cds n=1 Tax=Oikopleura dioica TaxID=34765 RepID=A0ABN7SWM6_OIKDI|nr:Oidioi.mRNA.OKI2018_I69.chr1.g1281.t1.cds [Oikopleura dioica]
MKLSNLLLVASVHGKSGRNWVGKNSNRYVPECESGRYNVADISVHEEKLNDSGSSWDESLDHHFGACWMQGMRNHMEDRVITRKYLTDKHQAISLYIVFDGHGGDEIVKLAEKNLTDFLLDSNQKLFESLENQADDIDPNEFKKLVEIQFPKFDVELMHEEKIHKKLLDPKIRSTSGCTCTGVFLTPDHVILFNVGDSRTILINENEDSPVIFASKDHKPDDPVETARINAAGGFVTLPPKTYIPRVMGQLALSRAFGDFQLKMKQVSQSEQPVIVDPDVTILDRSKVTHIVVGSDGVFDDLTNEEVAAFATGKDGDIQKRTYDLLRKSLSAGSQDNMAAIVIALESE